MIPKIAGRGHSFKGAGAYYLHDKNENTTERVDWVQSVNLLSRTPEKALKEMAWTDINADSIREINGGSKVGRKATAGNVYSYSLSYAQSEKPTKDQALEAASETLKALGMQDHQALIIAHNDTDHDHVHVLVNLVNPDTGRIADIHNDALTLSEWAEDYEHRCGVIHCAKRVKNNDRREQGEYVKHKPDQMYAATSIEELYQSCSGGAEFKDAVETIGYTLGRGDRRGFVLVDREGEVHSLSRQVKGVRAKDIKAYMSDLDISALPTAKEIQEAVDEEIEEEEQAVSVSFEDIEEALKSEVADKRKALIDDLDKQYKQREQDIQEEQELQNAVFHASGLSGIWNAVTGRTKHARDCLAQLRAQERRIRLKRIEAVMYFEEQQDAHMQALRNSEKQREEYQRWVKLNASKSPTEDKEKSYEHD